jgi:hypothetical protein
MTVARTCRFLVIPLAAFAASTALAGDKAFDKRFNAPPGGHLTLHTDAGAVAVVGHDAREVVIHAEISGPDADRMIITAEQDSSGVTVTGRKTSFSWFGWTVLRVKFTIDVPRDYPLELETAGGALDVRNLNASVQGTTSGGSIDVRDVIGATNMHTSGGRIDAERLSGPTELTTSGGSIDVNEAAGNLDVRTSGGSIRLVSIQGRVAADTSGGSIRAEVRENHGVSLTTLGGGITLLIPENTRASIDAATSGGSVESGIAVSITGTVDRSRLRGAINGGGEPIFLRTLGGGIQIEPLEVKGSREGPAR